MAKTIRLNFLLSLSDLGSNNNNDNSITCSLFLIRLIRADSWSVNFSTKGRENKKNKVF